MAVSAYLFIKDVKGEAKDEQFKDHIEVQSFTFSASNPSKANLGTGHAGGRATCNDFVITKNMDLASPLLFQKCAQGLHMESAYMVFTRAGAKSGRQEKFIRFDFEDLVVSSYSPSGSMNDGGLPQETLSFNFGKVNLNYYVISKGELKGALAAGFNVREAEAVEERR